jgi:hypothetical protein
MPAAPLSMYPRMASSISEGRSPCFSGSLRLALFFQSVFILFLLLNFIQNYNKIIYQMAFPKKKILYLK